MPAARRARCRLLPALLLPAGGGTRGTAADLPSPAAAAATGVAAAACSGEALGSEAVLRVTKAEQEFVFEGVEQAPVPSLLRGFSGAPWLSAGRRLACLGPATSAGR